MKTVLVVDDDTSIRTFVGAALGKRRWAVIEAEDGVDGVARFMLHRPDVLLTDLSMPKTDGLEMIHNLRQSGELEGVRLVIMSGVLGLTTQMREETGAAALLRKPFTLKELYAAVGDGTDGTNEKT